MNEAKTNHIIALDVMRALCIIWIVCIWHVKDYMYADYCLLPGVVRLGCSWLTSVVLALFTFISGFLMAKYTFESFGDCRKFAYSRIKRLLIPFLLAVALFYALGWVSLKGGIKTLLGVSMYRNCAPSTLWYISMLVSFYVMTPVLRLKRQWWYSAVVGGMIFIGMVAGAKLGCFDARLAYYFPFYVLGLIMNQKWFVQLISGAPKQNSVWWKKPIEVVAYASMAMYLFHRPIYYVVANVVSGEWSGAFNPDMSFPTAMVGAIIVFIISYAFQKGYDWLLNEIKRV